MAGGGGWTETGQVMVFNGKVELLGAGERLSLLGRFHGSARCIAGVDEKLIKAQMGLSLEEWIGGLRCN